MRRRDLIASAGVAAVTWPLGAGAQQAQRRRVGILTDRTNDSESRERIAALRQRLNELGWRDGTDIQVDLWTGSENETWAVRAAALVASAPDVIVVAGNPGVAALREQTRTIPIVFVLVGDPVGSDFVASFARPGGNITGFSHYDAAMGGKWLEVLTEVAHGIRRAQVLVHPDVRANAEFARTAEAAGAAMGIEMSTASVRSAVDLENAVTAFGRQPDGGLVVLPNPVSATNHQRLVAAALARRLPAISAFRYITVSGLLASYGIVITDVYRTAAEYVDRILKGAKPMDLPVQGPTRLELVINLKAAKALGLTIPPAILARADEVIE